MSSFNTDDDNSTPIYSSVNGFPLTGDGRVLHMDLREGDLANRIVTVGAEKRAEVIAGFLDQSPPARKIVSHRGFVTYTGTYEGTPVSIVAIGMGLGMMDLFVRESRAIVRGPMAIIRFGTCGGLSEAVAAGTVGVAAGGSGYITRNPDAFHSEHSDERVPPYLLYKPVPSDEKISELLHAEMTAAVGADKVCKGMNVTADTFYASQGRHDDRFDDRNADVLHSMYQFYSGHELISLEMETFVLFDLARVCRNSEPIRASAAAIILSNRTHGTVCDDHRVTYLEKTGGEAVLKTVARVEL